MAIKNLYHGSQKIIQQPEYGKGKAWNDYGKGFYCTEEINLAKEWACPVQMDGFVNKYTVNTENLNILNLSDSKYNTLHWLTLLVCNRVFDRDTPVLRRAVYYLKKNFLINTDDYDVITGYRADDSYFAFAKAFLSNQISYQQLQSAMKLGKLGEQFVLKSEKAFGKIIFTGYEAVEHKKWYSLRKNREGNARNEFNNLLLKDDIYGLFMRDIILNEVNAYDPRLQ